MSSHRANTPGAWHSFVDAWAQHHGVEMSEQARAALCNAMGNLTEAELAAIRACPAVERVTVTLPAWGSIPQHAVTYRPESASQPLQSTATPPARPSRTPPRAAPRTAPSAPAQQTRPPARIIRRTVPIK